MTPDEKQHMCAIVANAGLDSAGLDDEDLEKLWVAKYRTAERLRAATREGLVEACLAPGTVDAIRLALGVAAGPGSMSTGAGGVTTSWKAKEVSINRVKSEAWKGISMLVGISLVATPQAPLTAPPAVGTKPFAWGQGAESSLANRKGAIAYLNTILSPPIGQEYYDCASTRSMLSCQLPGTGYKLKGTTDIAICTSAALKANIPAHGMHVLFEVKRTKGEFNIYQLATELLAAHMWSSHLKPIAVMTDLMYGWCLMWAVEKDLKVYTCSDRAEAIGILRAFLDKDILLDSTPIMHQQDTAGQGVAAEVEEVGGLLKCRRLQMGAGSGARADVANLDDLLDFGGDLGLGEADLHQLRSCMQLEALLELAAPKLEAAPAGGSRHAEEEAAFPSMYS